MEVSKMAILDIAQNENVSASRGVLSKLVASSFGALADWNTSRATRRALLQLSDRELEDIGLIPSDIDRIARR
jgi:uncharacterized protein YjiS (DUF1127 family)